MRHYHMIYKVLNKNGAPCHGGHGIWPLPHNGKPGDWLEVEGPLIPCQNGIHLCDGEVQLLSWLGPAIYIAEYLGEIIRDENKVVARKARLISKFDTWNDRSARLFACDCAERSLIRERQSAREPDARAWQAIEVARHFASGQATHAELAAARAAAWAAAWSAPRIVVWSAAWEATRPAANYAAWEATRDAAWSAASNAAWDAANNTGRDAAWAAAWSAAHKAERKWQANQLKDYLNGK